jgi:hypothetical protein
MTNIPANSTQNRKGFNSCYAELRGLQRDVVYLGWPIAPSNMSPTQMRGTGGGGELRCRLSQRVQLYTGAQINYADLTPLTEPIYTKNLKIRLIAMSL